MPNKIPMMSCRNGTPVVLITQQRTPIPCKIKLSTKQVGTTGVSGDDLYIVKVQSRCQHAYVSQSPTGFPACCSRRCSLFSHVRYSRWSSQCVALSVIFLSSFDQQSQQVQLLLLVADS
jgi:hypothetical protein